MQVTRNVMNKNRTVMTEEIIGYAGAVISSVSFMPQVIKIWKTKSAHDLSMITLFLLSTNAALWSVYGIMKEATPLWITNVLMLAMVVIMIIFKMMYRSNSSTNNTSASFT